MAYQALYRKWRPMDFESVSGQEQIVALLKNEVETNRVSHAYLLCGTRGTGKTTIAKILAKAVNCHHPKNGNPCNECESCRSINSGSSVDVIEIDAASNNKVDDIREIRDEVLYTPAVSKYKVYIIDEVHMLTTSAFNALLKTLEEPPSHVIFILATTEFGKVPATILSRCQRFDFKKIPIKILENRIKEVCLGEGATIEDTAVNLIAKLADGALRDALSILDQCINVDKKVTYEQVAELVGVGSRAYLEGLCTAIINSDFGAALNVSEEIRHTSKAYDVAASELILAFRDMLIIKTVKDSDELLNCTTAETDMFKGLAQDVSVPQLMCYIDTLQKELDSLQRSGGRKVDFEILLFKLCQPQQTGSLASLEQRIFNLETAVAGGNIKITAAKEPKPAPKKETEVKAKPQGDFWNEVLSRVDPSVSASLSNAKVEIFENEVVINADAWTHSLLTGSPIFVKQIADIIKVVSGKEYKVTVEKVTDKDEQKDAFDELAHNSSITFLD